MIITDYTVQAEFIKAWYAEHFPNLTVTNVTATMELTNEDDTAITDSKFCVSYADTCFPHIMSTDYWICKGPEDLEPGFSPAAGD